MTRMGVIIMEQLGVQSPERPRVTQGLTQAKQEMRTKQASNDRPCFPFEKATLSQEQRVGRQKAPRPSGGEGEMNKLTKGPSSAGFPLLPPAALVCTTLVQVT